MSGREIVAASVDNSATHRIYYAGFREGGSPTAAGKKPSHKEASREK